MFYKEKFIAAFSEESDPTHFQQVYDTEEEAKQFLWSVDFVFKGCMERVWWLERNCWGGATPQQYTLPKYKDMLADCAVVMAKKGQC